MRRFWIDNIPQVGKVTNLDAEESQHIAKVLRLSAGTEISVWDGESTASAVIEQIQKGTVWVEITQIFPGSELDAPQIHLYLPLIKAERFEWALEKATEIGADQITPFHSEYSQVNLKVAAAKRRRWERIIKEASKQCQRPRLPILNPAISLSDVMQTKHDKSNLRYICTVPDREIEARETLSAKELVTNSDVIKKAGNVEILVGPEGGFTPEEVTAAVSAQFTPLRLGENILRAETAALAATSLIANLR